jgi:hypothetical protein
MNIAVMPAGKKQEAVFFAFHVFFEDVSVTEGLEFIGAEFGEISVEFHFEGFKIVDVGLGAVEIDLDLAFPGRNHAENRQPYQEKGYC